MRKKSPRSTAATLVKRRCSLWIPKPLTPESQPQDTQRLKFGTSARQGQDEKPQPEFDLFDTSCEKDFGLFSCSFKAS